MDQELTTLGKLVFGSIIAWIERDAQMPFNVQGSPAQMQAFVEAAFAAKNLKKELQNPDATIESIMQLLSAKNAAAEKFETATNFKWPL